ncbi:MAG: glycosyltransferase family 2 protein, partial [Acetobacteraceae bacterium]
ASGRRTCALQHYLCNEAPTAFDPLPEFSEQYYLEHDHDVAAAVAAGTERSGYSHFLKHGALEQRSPCASIDLAWYIATHESVRQALEAESVPDAFTHYLMFGHSLGLATAPHQSALPGEAEADALAGLRSEVLLSVLGRGRLDLAYAGSPQVTVVMVTRNCFAAVMATLAAVCTTFPALVELVLVDCGSDDDTRFIDRFVSGATVLRLDQGTERVKAINAAASCATGGSVLLLEAGVEPDVGAIAAALARLASDARIGAVGGKIVRPHGRLHEAGGIVWNDGSTQLYLHDEPANAVEAGFRRDVDFCSGLMLLLRTSLLRELGGFDESLGADRAVVDLCLRLHEAGYRVTYDPAVVGHCRKVDPVATETADLVLLGKHAALLRDRPARSAMAALLAREFGGRLKRVLFLDDTVPLRVAGSGFVRSNDL